MRIDFHVLLALVLALEVVNEVLLVVCFHFLQASKDFV